MKRTSHVVGVGGCNTLLDWDMREGLVEKVTFKHRLEGNEKKSLADT